MQEKVNVENVKSSLSKPFAIDFSEYTSKVRNNLIFVSVLSIILIIENLELSNGSSFLGIKFEVLRMEFIYNLFLVLNTYFLIHFIWLGWDHFIQWKLRLTGANKLFSNQALDPIIHPDQTTLYAWWSVRSSMLHEDKENIEMIRRLIKVPPNLDNESRNMRMGEIRSLEVTMNALSSNYSNLEGILQDAKILTLLEQFDKSFKHMQSSQNLRWILIELALPIFLGISGCYLLLSKIYF